MVNQPICEICGGVLRIRKGDPPYRGSCPTCKKNHESAYKPNDLDQGSDFINTLKDAKETFDGFAFKMFWILVFVGLLFISTLGFFPSSDEESFYSDDDSTTESSSLRINCPNPGSFNSHIFFCENELRNYDRVSQVLEYYET